MNQQIDDSDNSATSYQQQIYEVITPLQRKHEKEIYGKFLKYDENHEAKLKCNTENATKQKIKANSPQVALARAAAQFCPPKLILLFY